MKQPIAGVTPPAVREVTVMTVFPTLGAYPLGRLIGQLCSIETGFGFFSLGKLFALLLIPVAIGLFIASLLPPLLTRYRLTNRRVVVQSGLRAVDQHYVDFDRFDAIDIEVLPGQAWFPAGDLVFRQGAVETFDSQASRGPRRFAIPAWRRTRVSRRSRKPLAPAAPILRAQPACVAVGYQTPGQQESKQKGVRHLCFDFGFEGG